MKESQLNDIAHQLHAGAVIAYPTEAVWGLGCDPYNQKAVEQILQLKQRPVEKGLILVAGDFSQLDFLLSDLSDQELETLHKYWPGPYTFLIPDPQNKIPKWVKGDHPTVAVRISKHPLIKKVSECFKGPIVSTSANPAGLEPARDESEVKGYFDTEVVTIISGEIGEQAQPSQIRDLRTGALLRA